MQIARFGSVGDLALIGLGLNWGKPVYLPVDDNLVAAFEGVLKDDPPAGRQKEQVVLDFMEMHSELVPTPNLLNHHLHFQSIVSKFPLGTELTTDYLYLTKSSGVWRVTFVEIEDPDKKLFNSDTKRNVPSAEFNAALNQVRSWKLFLQQNRTEVLRRLEPLLQPPNMRRHPIEFAFQLIIGRSNNKIGAPRNGVIHAIAQEAGVDIFTYDSVIARYQSHERFKKNILRLSGTRYEFKRMHFEPSSILGHLGPDQFCLSKEEMKSLKASGYEIDKWLKGDLLTGNDKLASSTVDDKLANGTLFLLDDPKRPA